jgi:NADH-quinone oxidoreductase subunit N
MLFKMFEIGLGTAFVDLLLITALLMAFLIIGINYPRLSRGSDRLAFAFKLNTFFIFILSVAAFMLLFMMYYELAKPVQTVFLFEMYFVFDFYTTVLKFAVVMTTILVLLASYDFLSDVNRVRIEYPVLVVFSMLFLCLLISSYNFISMFISIVGFSLNLYVLLLIDKHPASREAGVKYFYLSTFSTGLMLFGIFILYFVFHTTDFYFFKLLSSGNTSILPSATLIDLHIPNLTSSFVSNITLTAISFIMIGFFFKLAAFPCHWWTPEVYDGSPDPVMAFFILPVKIATFGFFVRLLNHVLPQIHIFSDVLAWKPLIFSAATGSMLVGCFQALLERKIKRFLAYTSINQMGFLLVGVCSNTLDGYMAALMYLLIYISMNVPFLCIFLFFYRSIVKLERDGVYSPIVEHKFALSLVYLTDFQAFAKEYRGYACILAIVLFSMAGLPLTAGFFGKFYLLLSAFNQFPLLIVIGLLTSLISTAYYIRIVKILFFEIGIWTEEPSEKIPLPYVIDVTIGVCLVFLVAFIAMNNDFFEFIKYANECSIVL